ncbi:MAG: metallophosphoesterase [Ignavibacteriales bacterium]|nr:metallophosphoesterase [Ignavibacteriales bacterium]
MKIVAVTDIHGEYSLVERMIEKEMPDITIIGGDITTVGSKKEVEKAIDRFVNSSKRVFAIAGNMDSASHEEVLLQKQVSLNARGVIIGGIGFFGASASPRSSLNTPYEILEDEVYDRISTAFLDVANARHKILVTHAPPHNTILDRIHSGIHVGSTAVRKIIEEKQPDVSICGHIHEAAGIDRIGKTVAVNCGFGAGGYYALVIYEENIFSVTNRCILKQ